MRRASKHRAHRSTLLVHARQARTEDSEPSSTRELQHEASQNVFLPFPHFNSTRKEQGRIRSGRRNEPRGTSAPSLPRSHPRFPSWLQHARPRAADSQAGARAADHLQNHACQTACGSPALTSSVTERALVSSVITGNLSQTWLDILGCTPCLIRAPASLGTASRVANASSSSKTSSSPWRPTPYTDLRIPSSPAHSHLPGTTTMHQIASDNPDEPANENNHPLTQ